MMFKATDESSKRGRQSTFRRMAVYLGLLVLAAGGAAGNWESNDAQFDIGALVAAAGFLAALVLGLSTAARRPEAQWYEGRAGAESVKTLAWRYAVGGEPYPVGAPDADARLLKRLSSIPDQLPGIAWEPVTPTEQITGAMRALRASTWEERWEAYVQGRVVDQLEWYSKKATAHRDRERRLGIAVAVVTGIGAAAALAQVVNWLELDLMGVLAALAAAIAAWGQAQQHRTLATAYSLAAQELAMVRDQLQTLHSEADWPAAVDDAEEAISREHTMWLARRGRKAPGVV
ncbi:DUF4231 domain-containing protein [Blastococcus sp. SYSU DS0619]